MRRGCRSRPQRGVLEQELEEADEVVRAPPALLVRLAETDRAVRRDAREEPVVEDVEPHGRAGAEPAHGAVRQPRLERAALEPAEGALDEREARRARASGRRGAPRGDRVAGRAHSRTDPTPGTKGGLWWNGTRFAIELQRLPVDQPDHLHRHQRVADEEAARGCGSSAARGGRGARRSAAAARPRARGCAPRPRPPARRTRTRSSGRARRTARRGAASRARSAARRRRAARAAARRRCSRARRRCTRARRRGRSTSGT